MPNNLIISTRQLGELAEVVTKGTTPTTLGHDYVASGIPFIRVNNLVGAYIDPAKDVLFIDEATDDLLKRSRIFPGDVLLSIAGTIGRASRVPANAPALNCNQAVCIIRCTPEVDGDFLRYWLESQSAKTQIASSKVTGVISNLSLAEVKSLKVPLPPLPGQRCIAAILDKADALRAKRRETIAKLDQLLQSVFLEMFGDPVTNPKGWPETDFLGDVADICSGITKGRRTTEKTRETPYLSVANVQDRHLKLGSVKTICATDAEIERYRLAVNDLLLTEGGDPDKLGRGALWDGSIRECIHQNHVFRVRITSPLINPVFLNWLVGSARGKRYFLSVSKQTTGIASINMTQLKKFPLLTPPIELQTQFAQTVSKIEAHQRELETAAVAVDQLFQSLQQQAFAGQL